MQNRPTTRPRLEELESRWCPAITASVDTDGNLVITGDATASVNVTLTSNGIYTVQEGGSPSTTSLNAPGDVLIDLGHDTATIDGVDTITINLAGFSIPNDVLIASGFGFDRLTLSGTGTIFGSIEAEGINNLTTNGQTIRGNIVLDSTLDNTFTASTYTLTNTRVGGALAILAGNNDNAVTLVAGANARVGGNVYLSFGNGTNSFSQGTVQIGGSFTFLGGSGDDSITLNGRIGANVYVNVADGSNDLVFTAAGRIYGSRIYYYGGFDDDRVVFRGQASQAQAYFYLGADEDRFTLGSAAALRYLFVDFGQDADTFTNELGLARFPLVLRNLS